MCFVGTVETCLLSGSNYNGGGVSYINTLKTSKCTLHSVCSSQRTPHAWSKPAVFENNICQWLFTVGKWKIKWHEKNMLFSVKLHVVPTGL